MGVDGPNKLGREVDTPGLPVFPHPISFLCSSAQDLLFCWPPLHPPVSMGSRSTGMGHGAETSLTHVRYPCRDPGEVYDDVEPTYHSWTGPQEQR